MTWRVIWDNGHACGALSGTWETREAAEAAGRNWQAEMISATPGATESDYSFEVSDAVGLIDWHTATGAEVPHVAVYRHEGGGDETRIADVYIHDGNVGEAEGIAIRICAMLNGGST